MLENANLYILPRSHVTLELVPWGICMSRWCTVVARKLSSKLFTDSDTSCYNNQFNMADKVKATCPVCQMEFIQIESHLATAHKEHTTCQCSKCDKQFVREQNLNQHLVEYHNAKAKTNWCITCFKSFPSILDMKRHLSNVHIAKETFKCQVCNYSTTTKSSLRHHTFKMHKRENSKSVKCDVCHKMYASEFWMHRHKMLVHFDEKRYSCSTCDFKVKTKSETETYFFII
jgi:KRAB domain-containing zinc finger protein